MKRLKLLVCVFVLSIISLISGVNADDGWKVFRNIKVPSMQGTYTSNAGVKTVKNAQKVFNISSIDNFSNDDRMLSFTTVNEQGKKSPTIYAVSNQVSEWVNGHETTGGYTLKIKATKWTTSSVNFYGMWYLDGNLYS